jgi:diaminopimelate decarboxylase
MLSTVGDTLRIEQCSVPDLARQFGTPLYVVSENQVRRNVHAIRQAFAKFWPFGAVRILPSEKASLSLAVRRILVDEGAGCDTFGEGELRAALRCRVPAALISVNGTGKSRALLEHAVAAGARVTLDSAAEYSMIVEVAQRLGLQAKIRVRVRPAYADLDQGSELRPGSSVKQAANAYKPGIPLDLIENLGREAIRNPHVHLTGLMAHLGRHRSDADTWARMGRSFGQLVGSLCKSWGDWKPEELDIGGGFAAPRDPTSPEQKLAPAISEVAEAVTGALAKELKLAEVNTNGLSLELEPGRSLFANTGIHLTRVRHVKHQHIPDPRRWIETDTSEIFLPDIFAEHSTFRPLFANRVGQTAVGIADIVGISCTFDVLAGGINCPDVEEGDVIAFLDTGAYQDAGASNFNAMPRPGIVLVNGSAAEWIKRPETIADVFSRDIIPKRLA